MEPPACLAFSRAQLTSPNNLTVVNARTRFASGAVCFFIDGPWLPGGSKILQPSFVPKIGAVKSSPPNLERQS